MHVKSDRCSALLNPPEATTDVPFTAIVGNAPYAYPILADTLLLLPLVISPFDEKKLRVCGPSPLLSVLTAVKILELALSTMYEYDLFIETVPRVTLIPLFL